MKLWSVLTNAFAGWLLIVRGGTGWRERFALTVPGLATAIAIFAFTIFIVVAITSASIGMPSLFGVVAAMFALALPLISLVIVLLATRMALQSREPMLPVLVPATYILVAFVLVEGFLAILGGPAVMVAWLGLGSLLFQLIRAATSWNIMISAGVAVLTVVLLVAMRLALYMLSSLPVPAP